ncbi:hypothetical protein NP493_524g00020 [Ridgeia piscesae]|uniref:Uncharacterized protein n=1 Tax=Ridgeia piscesae TaxID=27915 RepID=A0AAD9NS98_RIDPI|nr:hypothetical protein NP493_524g00020 [Ridgeia piscesae]
MNENSPNHDVSPNGIANGASPEVNYHNGSVQLKDASPKKVKLTLRIKKQRSLENDIADMDKVASDASPEGKYHHGNIRLKDASPKKVESTSRLNKQRLHENEMADMDDVASDASPEVHYHHGSIRLKDASPKKVESTFRLKKQRLPEKCVTSKTIDITNSNEPVDSDSTDVYYVEESNDVLFLSSEAASSSESAVCTSGCPRTDSGSSHTVAYRHSPKKRLFQNGIRKRELTETDTLCSANVSQSEEMDRDFALSLAESENRTTADSSTSPELPRDLADNLHQVIGDLEMATSNIIDYGPIHVRSRGANTCVHANVGLCRQHIDLLPQRLYSGPQTGRDVSCNICMCDYETGWF